MAAIREHESARGRTIARSPVFTVFALAVLAILIAGVFTQGDRERISYLEAQFADTSTSGLAIVPASCPSDPPHFTGDTGLPNCSTPSCPSGFTLVGGICVSTQCPVGFTFTNGSCVFNGCPSGYNYEDGECVLVSCPLGYALQGGACVFVGCPNGYKLVGVQCVLDIECPLVCSGKNLVNSCNGQTVQICAYQCSSGACVAAPVPEATLTAQPSLVRSGNRSVIKWVVQYVSTCTVVGSNGDSWASEGDGTFDEESGPILSETTYTLTCDALNGSDITRGVKVGIIPTFEEQ